MDQNNTRDRIKFFGVAVAAISIVLCASSIICLVLLRLYNKSSYRLALYQVSSSLLFGVAGLGAFYSFPMSGSNSATCMAFAFLVQYTIWVQIVFTACLTFHLFCLSVFYKNLAKCESTYVLFSLLVPFVLAIVPLTTKNYGPSDVWCWIQSLNYINSTNGTILEPNFNGKVEQMVLLYGPAFAILLACSGGVIVMGIILACRAFKNGAALAVTNSGQQHHQKLLKQLLPLIIYPIIFFLYFLTPFAHHLYMIREDNVPPNSLTYAAVFFITSWCMAPGVGLLVHMAIIFYITRRRRGCGRKGKNYISIDEEGIATRGTSQRAVSMTSATHYVIPDET